MNVITSGVSGTFIKPSQLLQLLSTSYASVCVRACAHTRTLRVHIRYEKNLQNLRNVRGKR